MASNETAEPTPRVLIVDDNKEIATLLSRHVKDLGYEARQIGMLSEILPALDDYEPHVVLLDVLLPDGNGLSVIPTIRAHKAHPAIIVLTGLADEASGKAALTAGAFDYVTKPIDFKYVRATESCAIGQSGAGLDSAAMARVRMEDEATSSC